VTEYIIGQTRCRFETR